MFLLSAMLVCLIVKAWRCDLSLCHQVVMCGSVLAALPGLCVPLDVFGPCFMCTSWGDNPSTFMGVTVSQERRRQGCFTFCVWRGRELSVGGRALCTAGTSWRFVGLNSQPSETQAAEPGRPLPAAHSACCRPASELQLHLLCRLPSELWA